jgi:hypothetical protein
MVRNFKISFYVNSHVISCSRSERWSASSSTWMSLCGGMMGTRQWWKGMTTAGGAPMAWCSSEGGGKMETRLSGEESNQDWDDLFIAVEGGTHVVRGGWTDMVMQIQCFSFDSRGKVTWWCIIRRWMRRQWARLDSMERKSDTVRWRGDVGRRRGGTGEGKDSKRHQLG